MWIKCSDELPREMQMVLCACDGDYEIGMNFEGLIKVFSMGAWIVIPGAEVTHWMKLPELPND